jgi:hypothetical protein
VEFFRGLRQSDQLPPALFLFRISEQFVHSALSKPTDFFRPDPDQVRKDFPKDELRALGASLVKRQLVPLIARKSGMIVDGERRWRGARLVGKKRSTTS